MANRFKDFDVAEVVEMVNALALHLEIMKTYSPADDYEIDVISDLYKEASEEADKLSRYKLIQNHEGTEH